ncbi:MAG TPA: hypothetical protein VOB72_10840 [Candidatus Dormibacteraeota bacterium]|nr:hypothetical protein [Candidatus Dormibacteraeota bacterium]
MTFRLVFGLGWALAAGLAGGWLVLAPWALGAQRGGDWSTLTRNEVFSGLGLIALAVLGVAVVAAQVVRSLREAGVLAPTRPAALANGGVTSSPEMEKALIALAQALAEDLESSQPEPVRERT